MEQAFDVHIPARIDRQLRALELATGEAIRAQLLRLARASAKKPPEGTVGPALRFYEGGTRVLYRVEVDARRIVVIALKKAFPLFRITSKKSFV